MAAAQGMGATEGHDLAVIEAHAVEGSTQGSGGAGGRTLIGLQGRGQGQGGGNSSVRLQHNDKPQVEGLEQGSGSARGTIIGLQGWGQRGNAGASAVSDRGRSSLDSYPDAPLIPY